MRYLFQTEHTTSLFPVRDEKSSLEVSGVDKLLGSDTHVTTLELVSPKVPRSISSSV